MEKYSALIAVDAEKFSAHPDTALPGLHMEIRHVLQAACEASGIGEIWESVPFKESTGDGILAVLPHLTIPTLIDPFARHLQETLAGIAPRLRAQGGRLRLRVALHAGLVDDERPEAPGISTATVDVSRLLNSRALREALNHSDPYVTFAAFLLSAEVFGSYVEGGRTTLRPTQCAQVEVRVKQFARPAYLYVPVPSREGEPPSGGAPEPGPEPTGPHLPPRPSINGVSISAGRGSQNLIGNSIGSIGGDIRMTR